MSTTNVPVSPKKDEEKKAESTGVKCEFVCPTCGDHCERTDARDHGTGENLCAKHYALVHKTGGA